ncbi:MAG: micrococcal nuclease [Acidimicrobiaceae bacterium]|jgi:micrococcal nuclease
MVRSIAVACIVLLASGCAQPQATSTDGRATVVRVIDGDTIVVRIGGRDENIRLLGIDTPETHKPDTPVECYGPEASDRMAALLPAGTAIRLVRDVEARDRFGRLLAYVYRDSDGLFIDLTMVSEGYAGTLSIKPNFAHRGELEAAATAAQAARRGLWQVCGGNHAPSGG